MNLTFTTHDIGFVSLAASGTTFPDKVLDAAKAADGIVLGPVSTIDYPPASEGGINPSGFLRKQLDLYANIRPAKSYEGLPPRVGLSPNDALPPRGLSPNDGLPPRAGLSPNDALSPRGLSPNDGLPPRVGLSPNDALPPRAGPA